MLGKKSKKKLVLWFLAILAAAGSIFIATILFLWLKSEEPSMQNGWYEIRTARDYQLFWELVADGQSDLNGRLMKDIKLNNLNNRENWCQMPPENQSIEVGSFEGIFDGNGYTIYGLYSETGYGLVRENFGTIQNVSIRDSVIRGEYFTGGICYRNYQVISNCCMTGELCHNEDHLARMAGVSVVNIGLTEVCTYNGIMDCSPKDGDRAGICAENSGKIEGCGNLADQNMEEISREFYHTYAISDEGMKNCYVKEGTGWFVPEASHVLQISEDYLYMLPWLMKGNCYPLLVGKEPLSIGQRMEEAGAAGEDAFLFDIIRHLLEQENGNTLQICMQAVEKEEREDCIFAVKLTLKGQPLEVKAYLAEEFGENYEMPMEYIAEILGEAVGDYEVDDQEDSWEHRTYRLEQLSAETGSWSDRSEEIPAPENFMLYRTKWETGFWYRQGEKFYRIVLPKWELSQGTEELWDQILNRVCTERKVSDGIAWKDECIQEAVYKQLSQDDQGKDRIFSLEEIREIKELTIENAGWVKSYQDLQYLPELTSLKLHNGTIQMGEINAPLTSLGFENCYIVHLENISCFSELRRLEIVNCKEVDDFTFLENLPQLRQLSIENSTTSTTYWERKISREMISAVSKCKKLERLSLSSSGLSSIEELSEMTNLQELDLSFNNIDDFSPLYGLRGLRKLWVNDNPQNELGQLVYIPDLSIGSHRKTEFELDELKMAQQVLDDSYPDNCLLAKGIFYRDIEARDLAWGDFNEDGTKDLAVIGERKKTFDQEGNRISSIQRKIYLFQGTQNGFEEVQIISLSSSILTKSGYYKEEPVSYIAISGNHLLVQTMSLADEVGGSFNSISVYTWIEGKMEPECKNETDYELSEDKTRED